MKRRIPLIAVAIGLTLAACGTSDPAATTTPDAPAPESTEAAPETDAPAESPVADTEPEASESPAEPPTEPPVSETPATDTPEAAPTVAEPEPAPIGGRSLATSVEPDAQFEGNPFPDLVVDDIGRGGEANIANILPSDRPVLLWTWAPH